ncbi:unnamed protein product [Brassica oleracea]
MEAVMNSYACHMLDKMFLRGKKVKMKIKKRILGVCDSEKRVNMKRMKSGNCQLIYVHQMLNRKWLLGFKKKKTGKMRVEIDEKSIEDTHGLMKAGLVRGDNGVKRQLVTGKKLKFKYKRHNRNKKSRDVLLGNHKSFSGNPNLEQTLSRKIDGDKISYLRSDKRHQLYGIVRSCVKLLFVDKRKTTKPNSPELEFKHELEFAHLIRRLGRILKKLEEWSKQMLKQEQKKQRKRLKLQGLAMLIETMREKTKTTHQRLGCGSKAKKDYRKVSQGKSNSLYSLLHTKRDFTIQSSWRMKGYKLVKCFCVLVDELLDGNGDGPKSTVEYGIKFSLGSIELKKLLMEWEKHKAGDKYKKKHTARNKVSFSEKYVVNLVNLMRKQFLTSGKRAKFRQKVMSNGLGCLEMMSPPRMTAGKKASSKSLCGFVFLLHILENQIMESASPPGDAEHNDPEAVHENSNKRSSGQN